MLESPKAHYDPLKPVLDNLLSIQLAYREEVTRIFSQFATRGAQGTREKWDAYVAGLRRQCSHDQILANLGDLPGEPMAGREPATAERSSVPISRRRPWP